MARRQVHDRGFGLPQSLHRHTLFIQRHRDGPHQIGPVDLGDLAVTGIFQTKTAVASQKLDQNIIEVFRPRSDHDAVGIGLDAAAPAEHPGDGTAQLLQPHIGHRL